MKASGIGGQAVMEGVMMKNGDKYAVAVRKEDQSIVVDVQEHKGLGDRCAFFRIPIVRGVVAFIESLALGVKTLTYSASFFDEEDPTPAEELSDKDRRRKERKDNAAMAGTVCLSVVLAVGIFMILPYFLSRLLASYIESESWLALCEGLIRVVLFVGYVAAISLMKDIKRVYMYHGAEHKSINCIERGFPLTVENVRMQSRQHKRCGTSFMLIVMLISVLLFMVIRLDTAWMRLVVRLLMIPVIAGISYEFIKLAGRTENPIVGLLSRPGLALQRLTTAEPDDSMIEVAIASVEAVFDWQAFLEHYDDDASSRKASGKNAGHNGRPDKKQSGRKAGKADLKAEQARKEQERRQAEADRKAAAQARRKAEREAAEEARAAEEAKRKAEKEAAEAAKAEEKARQQAEKEAEEAARAEAEAEQKREAAIKAAETRRFADEEMLQKVADSLPRSQAEQTADKEDTGEDNVSEDNKKKTSELGYFKANRQKAGSRNTDDTAGETKLSTQSVDDVTRRKARLRITPSEERLDLRRPLADEDEDDEILKALDQFFVRRKVAQQVAEGTVSPEEAAAVNDVTPDDAALNDEVPAAAEADDTPEEAAALNDTPSDDETVSDMSADGTEVKEEPSEEITGASGESEE